MKLRRIAALVAGLWLSPALAQQPAPPPDPIFEAARIAFEALPEAERKTIQEALVWTGDYNGVTSGAFGRRTYDAILSLQRRAKAKTDGILDAKSRVVLDKGAASARDAIGFKTVLDPRTKARFGLPQKILTKSETVAATGGTRWQDAAGKVTLDSRAYPPSESDLPQLFERLTQPTPNSPRKVTYKLLRPDFLVVSGETPTGKFYVRYSAGPEGLRGFSLGYDKSLAPTFDRIVIAMANSYAAYPGAESAVAAAPVPPPSPARAAASGPSGLIASAVMVGPRRALTSASIKSCGAPTALGGKVTIVESDEAAGLALIEFERPPRAAPPLRLAPTAAPGTALVVLGFAQSGSAPAALVVAPGEALEGGRIGAPLQPGAAGAPVFDRAGGLAGIVATYPQAPLRVAGIVPPSSYRLGDAAAFARLAEKAGLAPASGGGAPGSTGDVVAKAGPAVIAIECGR